MPVKSALYDDDFYAWSGQQAALLRAGQLAQADIDNIAEEIDSMGRMEKRELVSRLTILLLHALKWQFQPKKRGRSWQLSLDEQRFQVASHLADNPSLKARLAEAMAEAYHVAVLKAARETRLTKARFPAACPYLFEQMMDEAFWPE